MVSAPLDLYIADVGTGAPELSQPPPPPWMSLGRRGRTSIGEDGVSIDFTETIEAQRDLTTSTVTQLFRSDQDLLLKFSLMDLTVATFAELLGIQTPNVVAAGTGTAGYIESSLLRPGMGDDFDVRLRSYLVRTDSPYGDDMNAQFWIPRAYTSLSGSLVFEKGHAVELECEVLSVRDTTYGYGLYQAQHEMPL